MLRISDLSVNRGIGNSIFQVKLPSLSLAQGEVLAIQGVSGCGKSTLLEMIGLILKPDTLGSFQLLNQEINEIILQQHEVKLAKLRSSYFGFMLQTGGLLPYLTVKENIVLSCQLINQPINEEWLLTMIDRLSIGHLLQKYPKQLSIGERQRVSFLRAIAHRPNVLLADEPTAALDPGNASLLFDIIVELVKENQLSALIVTHDWDMVHAKGISFLTACIEGQKAIFQQNERIGV